MSGMFRGSFFVFFCNPFALKSPSRAARTRNEWRLEEAIVPLVHSRVPVAFTLRRRRSNALTSLSLQPYTSESPDAGAFISLFYSIPRARSTQLSSNSVGLTSFLNEKRAAAHKFWTRMSFDNGFLMEEKMFFEKPIGLNSHYYLILFWKKA